MVSEFLNLIDVPYFSHDCRHFFSRKSCDKISKSTLFPSFVCLFIIVNVSRVVFCLLIFRCGLSVVTQSLPLHIHFPHGPPQNVVALSLPRLLRSSVYKTFPLLCFPNVRLFTFGRRRRSLRVQLLSSVARARRSLSVYGTNTSRPPSSGSPATISCIAVILVFDYFFLSKKKIIIMRCFAIIRFEFFLTKALISFATGIHYFFLITHSHPPSISVQEY